MKGKTVKDGGVIPFIVLAHDIADPEDDWGIPDTQLYHDLIVGKHAMAKPTKKGEIFGAYKSSQIFGLTSVPSTARGRKKIAQRHPPIARMLTKPSHQIIITFI